MNVLVAVDSFKGSLSSIEAGNAVESGFLEAFPTWNVHVLPIADGGEGTAQVVEFLGGQRIPAECQDIYGRPNLGYWMLWNDIGVVEAAKGSGFVDPAYQIQPGDATTSFGTGQLIHHAVSHPQVKQIVVALGGSGSSDGGMGLLAALGGEFLDRHRQALSPMGTSLGHVAYAKIRPLAKPLVGLTDVSCPLTGPNGSVFVFGPQKGIPSDRLESMDADMMHYARVTQESGCTWDQYPGAGSAGGMGFGVLCLGGLLESGAERIAQWVSLDHWIGWADCVITGEGRLDSQTLQGKLVDMITHRCRIKNKPVIAIVGSRTGRVESLYHRGMNLIYPMVPGPLSLEEAMTHAQHYIKDAAMQIAFTLERCKF